MNAIPTVGVLLFKDNKVLLVRHGEAASHLTGSYGVPAGRFQEGESPKEAAIRELKEETGLQATASDLVKLPISVPPVAIPRKDGTTKQFTITLFYCKQHTGNLRSSDEATPEWVALDRLDTLQLIGHTKSFVLEGFSKVMNRQKARVSIIVAIDDKRGIGKENKLLFKISEDLKHFRQLTKGHAVIMGRKTYDSIIAYNGKPLPGRLNVVLSRNASRQEPGFEREENSPLLFSTGLQHALKLAEEWERRYQAEEREIFIIGGGQIFHQALEGNLVDRIYLTKVKGDYDADAFFPDYESFGFASTNKEDKESDGYQYSFITLKK